MILSLRATLALVLLGASSLVAQEWAERTPRPFDFAFVMNGGLAGQPTLVNDSAVWSFDGQIWKQITELPAGVSQILGGAGDPVRGQIVLLAIVNGTSVWTLVYDGVSWQQFPPVPTGVPNRLFFDPTTGMVTGFQDDQRARTTSDWAWNGTAWVLQGNGRRPFGLVGFAVADQLRNRVVLIGDPGSGFSLETWEWDGATWSRVAPGTALPFRQDVAMAFDPSRGVVVRHGGASFGGAQSFNDTWEWDGSTWTERMPATTPPNNRVGRLIFDPVGSRLLRVDGDLLRSRDWEWDGVDWTPLAPLPGRDRNVAAATDFAARQIVRFHGDDDSETWLWDGGWTRQATAVQPPPRSARIAWNPLTGNTLLFGGQSVTSSGVVDLDDTWEWDGSSWTEASPSTVPSPRSGQALAGFAASGGVVMFGGNDSSGPLAETWLWDGANWTDLTPFQAVSPPAGGAFFEAVYPNQSPHLISGGELWQWTGSWQRVSTTVPGSFILSTLSRDARTGHTVLTGFDAVTFAATFWIWDGQIWSAGRPMQLIGRTAALDPVRRTARIYDQRREFVYATEPASLQRYGSACGAVAPVQLTQGVSQIARPNFGLAARLEPGQAAAFLLGLRAASLPLGGGCTLLVDAPQVVGLAASNAQGYTTSSFPLPAVPALRGLDLFAQTVASSPSSASGLTWSGGLRVRIGD